MKGLVNVLEFAFSDWHDLTNIECADTEISQYHCPECNNLLIAKNRDFTGRTMAKHYAHYGYTSCPAAGESTLHINTKLLLYEFLENNIKFNVYLQARIGEGLQCIEYDILEGTDEVRLEKRSLNDQYIPDISLFYKGELVKAIEIVNTHEDSEDKIQMYKKEGVKTFVFHTSDRVYKSLLRGSLPIFSIQKGQTLSGILKN